MKQIFLLLLLSLIASCANTVGTTNSAPCTFVSDTLRRDSVQLGALEDALDSTKAYVYVTQNVRMDSLLPALCKASVQIQTAYLVTSYLCKDAIGPRPVVVLNGRDDRLLTQGFHHHGDGLGGRFGCADAIARFTPAP